MGSSRGAAPGRERLLVRLHLGAQRTLRHLLRLGRIQSRYQQTSLGRIHYYDSRPDSGESPALFLHGLGATALTLMPIAGALSRYRRVVVPDILHFAGLSEPAVATLDTEGHVRALAELLDGLRVDGADVCGHSLGGGAGIHLATRHPGLVRSLAMINPGGFSFGFTALRDRLLALDPVRAAELYQQCVYGHRLYHAPPLRLLGARLMHQAITSRGVRDYLLTVREHHYVDHALLDLRCRSLLLWGEADGMLPVETVRCLVSTLASLEAYWVKQSSHLLVLESPYTVYKALKGFWGIEPGPSTRLRRLASVVLRELPLVPILSDEGALPGGGVEAGASDPPDPEAGD
jgi:abhydrolase domain-containing protein 6